MKLFFFTLCIFLSTVKTSIAQQNTISDSIYFIQVCVLLPTKSGLEISATVVQKKSISGPLPVMLKTAAKGNY